MIDKLRAVLDKRTKGDWCIGEVKADIWLAGEMRKIAYCGPKLAYAHGMTQSRNNCHAIVSLMNCGDELLAVVSALDGYFEARGTGSEDAFGEVLWNVREKLDKKIEEQGL